MKWHMLQRIIPYLGLVVVIVFFAALTGGKILQPNNLRLIAEQSLTVLISATGVLFVMSMGSLDFSQGSILAFSCYFAALVSGYSLALAAVVAIVIGALIGAFNGYLNAVLKIQSFIATICTMFVFRGLTAFLTTNYAPKIPFSIYDLDQFGGKIAVVAFILVAGFILFEFTRFGRHVRMIGAGEIAAGFSGVLVPRVKIAAFVLAGAMAGVAGLFSLVRTGSITATTASLLGTDVMIVLVLGGLSVVGGARSKFSAVLIGGVLLAFLGNGLVQIGADPIVQQLVKGAVFLVTIIVTTDRKTAIVNK